MFNSPLEWCPVVRQWVALDEGVSQCAHEHHCKVDACPLARLFANQQPNELPPGDIPEASESESEDPSRLAD